MSEFYYSVLVLALSPVSMLWRGYVLSIIWRWFIVSAFGLPAIGVVQAMGLSAVVSFVVHSYRPTRKDERPMDERVAELLLAVALNPLFTLGIAYLIKLAL